MAGTAFTLMDQAKMVGQSIRNGQVFREYVAMHPLVGIILGNSTETMYGQGKKVNFERLNRTTGIGPRWHLDLNNKVARQLVLGSSSTNGEGAPPNLTTAQPPLSIQTGYYGMQVESTIYESDLVFQKGTPLITEDISKTEAARVAEAFMVHLAGKIYGTSLPDKNSFGGLQALVSDGLTTAQRTSAGYTDRTGTADESAYKSYGVDSSDPNYANHRSYVKPWTGSLPTVGAFANTIEKVMTTTTGKPTNVFEGVANYQAHRDAVDTTNGAIITNLNTKRQELGITGFTYRGIDFIMDPDIDIYCVNSVAGGGVYLSNQFAIDPSKYVLHLNEDVRTHEYVRMTGVANALWYAQWVSYMQMTLGSRRTQIKWCAY